MQEAIFTGRFRYAYLAVKTLALYAGVFLLCFYWPLFLSAMMGTIGDPRSEAVAGILLTPLGFLVLGAACGRSVALVHVALLVAAAGLTYATLPPDALDDSSVLVARWLPTLIGVHALGYVAGLRQQLARFQADGAVA